MDRAATIDVSAGALDDLRLAMAGQDSPQREAARTRIIQDHVIPRLRLEGATVSNVNWIDGTPGIFPVISSIEAEGTVTRRHGVSAEGNPACRCLDDNPPPYCPVHGPN
jgi:hypothetical protein